MSGLGPVTEPPVSMPHLVPTWPYPLPGTNSSGPLLNTTMADNNNNNNNKYINSNNISLLLALTSSPLSEQSFQPLDRPTNVKTATKDSSIIIKISLLLVVTAFVLVASYKFVVHLFVGYSDRKDDVFTDGYSDDEDSTGMKKHHGPILEIG